MFVLCLKLEVNGVIDLTCSRMADSHIGAED